ncbi:MAG TPA: MFS transporter [Candidatus Angelobacter sp.]|nr:MFS transporter [Candidatus Angelobacter sp.]
METKKLTLKSGIESNPPPKGQKNLSTDEEISGGGNAEPPPVVDQIGEATAGGLTPGEFTTAELTTDEPTVPRADALDGLAHGAVTDAAETTVIEIPRLARALRHRDFRLFWTGNFLSNIGTWMQNIAQGWLVLQLTNSAFWLGVVGFAASFPILLFALIGGVIADHVNKRKLLMVTQSAMMVFAFVMAALAYFKINGRPMINVTEIVLLALGTGIAMSLNTPTYQALVPQLVPREDLTNAIALNSAQFNMSRVLGPTLGGFAMALFGVAGNFFLNGLSFLAVLVALTRIRYAEPAAPQEGRLWEKLKQGFAYVFRHSAMSSLVLLVAIGSLLAIPYLTFVPYFARDVLASDEPGLGVLMACSGAGAFLGAVTIASLAHLRRRGLFVVRASAGFYAAIIAFTFSRNFYLSGLLLSVAGYCMIISVATVNSLLQHLAEDHMRGRVMSIYSTAFLGLPPIGCLVAGSMAHVVGAPLAIAGMSAVALLGSLGVFLGREGLRKLD